MNNWDSRYAERVKLLVEILPTLAEEKRFALKGGTAINLFERDLPRLSVDIDLTWLPIGDFVNDARIWRTFLVYLTCSPKPAAEMLAPQQPRDFEQIFEAHFQGMTATPVTATSLLDVRARLLQRVSELLDARSRAFLESVEREVPDFSLIGLPHAANLPGVRRKLANLSQRSAAKRAADYKQLATALSRRSSI